MSIVLAMDTSSAEGIIALRTDTGQILELKNTKVQQHNAFLLPGIQQLLREAGLELEEIDYLACSVGPGSFVGTRLAVAVTQGLAYGLKKPAIALNHLQILAVAARRVSHHTEIAVALDAKMQAYYFLNPDQHTHFYRLNEPSPIFSDHALKVGNGWPLLGYANALPELNLCGQDLLQLAEQNCQQALADPSQLLPVYLNDQSNWTKCKSF